MLRSVGASRKTAAEGLSFACVQHAQDVDDKYQEIEDGITTIHIVHVAPK